MRSDSLPVAPRKGIVSAKAWSMVCLSQAMVGFFYIDRQNLVVLKTGLGAIIGLGEAQYGSMVTGLMAAYAVGYFFSGWLIDTYGVRRGFPFFVGLMSVASIASGLVSNAAQMEACRVLLGAAEAGVMPASVIALVKWVPNERRASVQGLTRPILVAAQIASTTLPALLMLRLGWRSAFILPGVAGAALSLWWLISDRSDAPVPAGRSVSIIGGFREVLSSRRVRLLILARALTDPVWFFLVHWQATFLQEKLGMSLRLIALTGWIPTLARVFTGIALGFYIDRRIGAGRDAGTTRLRVLMGLSLLTPLVWLLPGMTNPAGAFTLLSLLEIVGSSWLALSTILMADLAKEGTMATAIALMNGVGVVVSGIVTYFIGGIITRSGYGVIFFGCGLAYPLGAVVLGIAAARLPRPIEPCQRRGS